MIEVRIDGSFEDWQQNARELLQSKVSPEEIYWVETKGQPLLFNSGIEISPSDKASAIRVPKHFISLARTVSAFRDPGKWRLLYSVLWRIIHENHDLLKIQTDDEVIQLLRMERAVGHDVHHIHAFVRFNKLTDEEGDRYVAWYRPDHKSLRLAAPFFAKRFASMRWSILTPDESAHWDGTKLIFSEGVDNPSGTAHDAIEKLWCKYYVTTFNPARTNLRMTRSEMPVRFWNNLPEMASISTILTESPQRIDQMMAAQKEIPGASQFIPVNASLPQLKQAIQKCQGCRLYEHATQAVFGEGPAKARALFVGEQPGDKEDIEGRPFVGPAGKVFDRALHEVGLDRKDLYITNAVKHFSFTPRGLKRQHRTPGLTEVTACRAWLEAEMSLVKPKVVVCLGATAGKSVFGPQFKLTESRGKLLHSKLSERTIATYHPSAVLRAQGHESGDGIYALLVADLKMVKTVLDGLATLKKAV